MVNLVEKGYENMFNHELWIGFLSLGPLFLYVIFWVWLQHYLEKRYAKRNKGGHKDYNMFVWSTLPLWGTFLGMIIIMLIAALGGAVDAVYHIFKP